MHRPNPALSYLRTELQACVAPFLPDTNGALQIDSCWFKISRRYIWCLRQPYLFLASTLQARHVRACFECPGMLRPLHSQFFQFISLNVETCLNVLYTGVQNLHLQTLQTIFNIYLITTSCSDLLPSFCHTFPYNKNSVESTLHIHQKIELSLKLRIF